MFIRLKYPLPFFPLHSGVLEVRSLDDAIRADYLIVPKWIRLKFNRVYLSFLESCPVPKMQTHS